LREKGYTFVEIGGAMNRSASALCDEVNFNAVKGVYDPAKAGHKAYVRRKYAKFQGKKIVENADLKKEIDWRLLDGQSPKAIAGWLRRHRKKKKDRASKNAIIRYLGSPYGRRIEAQLLLAKRKRKWRKKRGSPEKLSQRTFIDQRPKHINERKRIGDAEGDFIVSCKSGKGVLLTVADRKSRSPFIEQILHVTIPNVHRAFLRIKKRFPELKTLTTDNDLLFAQHQELERLLGIKIYFCHPYHSWEKGTIEYVNGIVRRDIPKGSDISRYSKRFIRDLEAKIGRRPMEVLGDCSPQEVLTGHRERMEKKIRNKKRPRRAIRIR